MMREAIDKIVKRVDLTEGETRGVFEEIMSGQATSAQIGSFLTAMRMKGETVDEITGAARVMREKSLKINAGEGVVVDTCGTGGSRMNTFNISTAAAFVAAGCDVRIAKHGNRGASSASGSADVLEALGVNLDAGPDIVERCMREIGVCFMYAPLFHSAMKYAVGPRKEVGIRTIFNMLGPLSNPANAKGHVLGVYDAKLTGTFARVLKNLGSLRAFIVHGMDGLDEITLTGRTKVTEFKNGRIKTYYISPEKFGLKRAKLDKLRGGTARDNAQILLSILRGEKGARRDVVLLNASAALIAGSKARDFKAGIKLAEDSIDSGMAFGKLQRLIEITNKR